MDTFWT
jgi:antitoxin VapB